MCWFLLIIPITITLEQKGQASQPISIDLEDEGTNDIFLPAHLPFKQRTVKKTGAGKKGHWKKAKQILAAENYHLLPATEPTCESGSRSHGVMRYLSIAFPLCHFHTTAAACSAHTCISKQIWQRKSPLYLTSGSNVFTSQL